MKLFPLFIIVLIICCNHPESTEYSRDRNVNYQDNQKISVEQGILNSDASSKYKVIGIKDGDTYDLLNENTVITIRSAHIDCPEKGQPYGQKAKQFVSDICFGKFVTLIHNAKYDRNKRLLAEVILEDGRNLNKLLVEYGLAWHYKKYSKDKEYATIEDMARANKLGLWADSNSMNPEIWRKK
jgi:endonuclease YncB( thermonuclease family)